MSNTEQNTLSAFNSDESSRSVNQSQTATDTSSEQATETADAVTAAARDVLDEIHQYPSDAYTTERQEVESSPDQLIIRDPAAPGIIDTPISTESDELPDGVSPSRAGIEIRLVTARTLGDYKAGLNFHRKTVTQSDNNFGPTTVFGTHSTRSDGSLAERYDIRQYVSTITDLVLSLLSYPRHDTFRQLDPNDVAILFPPVVTDFLAAINGASPDIPYTKAEVRTICESLKGLPAKLPDEPPTEDEQACAAALPVAYRHSDDHYHGRSRSSALHEKCDKLQTAIRARCRLSPSRYSSNSEAQVPAEYAHIGDLNQLNDMLTATRARIDAHRRAADHMDAAITATRDDRHRRLAENHLPKHIKDIYL